MATDKTHNGNDNLSLMVSVKERRGVEALCPSVRRRKNMAVSVCEGTEGERE